MYFKKQFQSLPPLDGHVPHLPFTYLPEIAFRAREKLLSRTTEHITAAAINISKTISDYFQDEKHGAIVALQRSMGGNDEDMQEYFEWDAKAAGGGRWLFKEAMFEELNIPNEKNTSEVGALKEKVDDIDFSGFFHGAGDDAPCNDYELFAVLALWLLSDTLHEVNRAKPNLSLAGSYAIKAMESVCHAELLHDNALLKELHTQSMSETESKLLEAWEQQKKEQQTKQIKRMNEKRHEETYKARDLAIKEWEKRYTKLSSEKAGVLLADWLDTDIKVSFEPRTVTSWIRAHKKAIPPK